MLLLKDAVFVVNIVEKILLEPHALAELVCIAHVIIPVKLVTVAHYNCRI